MNDKELNRTEQIKREELRIKRNKNIKKAIMGLIITFIIFIIANKAYESYREKIYFDKSIIMTDNERILREFDDYLQYVNNTITDLIFDQEIDKEFSRGRFSAMRQSFSNLSYVRTNDQKYKIDKIRLDDFFYESANSIDTLLKQDSISPDEKEFLSGIYKVNREVMNTYSEHIKRSYNNNDSDEIRYSLYYEGELLYHLSNTICASSDGVKTYIERDNTNESREYIDRTLNELQRSISDDKALSLANKMYWVIFDKRDVKLEETGYTSENFNVITGNGESFEDNSGTYTTSIKYSAEDFNENEYIEVCTTTGYNNVFYWNAGYSSNKEIPEGEIDKIADEIISKINCEILTLENKSEGNMQVLNSNKLANVLTYSYLLRDENYFDETTYVYLYIYKDGTIRGFDIGEYSLLDGTYKKITAKISPREAINALDKDSQNSIKSVALVKSYETYYQIIFSRYGIDFTARVNAESGELINIFGS